MHEPGETPSFPTAEELAAGLPQFEVEQCISSGQESAIYLGSQPALDRRVMIRVIAEPTTEEAAARLMERLRARARLVHPRIVAVYDFGRTSNGHLYLVTEHVDGRMLCDLVQERQVPPKMAYGLALQLCDILTLLHSQGTLHGSLSTRTLLVDRDGQMKVTGIGMCVAPSGEISWLHEGSASIEQDLYDLGLVLHDMFAKEPVAADGKVSRNIPPAFGAVLRRCLHPELARRFASAAEIKEALIHALRTQQSAAAKSAASKPNASTPSPPQAQRTSSADQTTIPAASKPAAAAAPAPPRYAPGRPPAPIVRAQPSFMRRLDDFLWSCLRYGLHLSVFVVTGIILFIFYVMKDKIILNAEDAASPPPEPELPAEMLGALPAAPMLPEQPAAPLSKPITLPPPDPLAGLNAEYRAAVQAEATAALEKVNLNELPAFQKELERIQNGQPVPATDEPGIPAALKRLREEYRRKR
ncbi:MAG: protein kinase, partial [Prosthecobacter sp.]|nr:protein kinase [Prosthecobacter sp.]